MDPNNRVRPQDISSRGTRPDVSNRPAMSARPVFNDFAPRPARPVLSSASPASEPVQTVAVANTEPAPTAQFKPNPLQTSEPAQLQPTPTNTPVFRQDFRPAQAPQSPATPVPTDVTQPQPPRAAEKTKDPKLPKEKSETGHAGLVGLAVFVILTGLVLSPLLPGKIFVDFPLSSQSMSEGDQALACIKPLGKVETNLSYDSKLGFPITYKYTTTTTQQASCEGKVQTATGGHAGQFNPLGAIINIAAAGVVACIIAFIWRKIFGHKDY